MGEESKRIALRPWLNPLRRFSRGEASTKLEVEGTLPKVEASHSETTSKKEQSPGEIEELGKRAGGDANIDPHQRTESSSQSQVEFSAAQVTHPWGVVDFHLYFNLIDGGKGSNERRGGIFLLTGTSSGPFFYKKSVIPGILEPETVGDDPKLFFECIPIPEPRSTFNGAQYALGLDLTSGKIFVRGFSFTPKDKTELHRRWFESVNVYQFSIGELYEIMSRSVGGEDGKLELPDLSSSQFCMVPDNCAEPGMELVILLRCCQFVIDLADTLLLEDHVGGIIKFKLEMARIVADWRFVLEQASSQAWIAEQDGVSRKEYTTQSSGDRTVYDLYTLGSLRDGKQELSAERIGGHGEECAKPFKSPIPVVRRQDTSNSMLPSSGASPEDTPFVNNDGSVTVPQIDIPFSAMLDGLADLARDYAEVDTEANRRRLGALLVDIQISIDQQ